MASEQKLQDALAKRKAEAQAKRKAFNEKQGTTGLGGTFQRKNATTDFSANVSDEDVINFMTQAKVPEDQQRAILSNPNLRSIAVKRIISSGLPTRRRATTRTSVSLKPEIRKGLSSAIVSRGGPSMAGLVPGLSDTQVQKLAFDMARRAVRKKPETERRTGISGLQLVRNKAFRSSGLKSGERLCMRIK